MGTRHKTRSLEMSGVRWAAGQGLGRADPDFPWRGWDACSAWGFEVTSGSESAGRRAAALGPDRSLSHRPLGSSWPATRPPCAKGRGCSGTTEVFRGTARAKRPQTQEHVWAQDSTVRSLCRVPSRHKHTAGAAQQDGEPSGKRVHKHLLGAETRGANVAGKAEAQVRWVPGPDASRGAAARGSARMPAAEGLRVPTAEVSPGRVTAVRRAAPAGQAVGPERWRAKRPLQERGQNAHCAIPSTAVLSPQHKAGFRARGSGDQGQRPQRLSAGRAEPSGEKKKYPKASAPHEPAKPARRGREESEREAQEPNTPAIGARTDPGEVDPGKQQSGRACAAGALGTNGGVVAALGKDMRRAARAPGAALGVRPDHRGPASSWVRLQRAGPSPGGPPAASAPATRASTSRYLPGKVMEPKRGDMKKTINAVNENTVITLKTQQSRTLYAGHSQRGNQ